MFLTNWACQRSQIAALLFWFLHFALPAGSCSAQEHHSALEPPAFPRLLTQNLNDHKTEIQREVGLPINDVETVKSPLTTESPVSDNKERSDDPLVLELGVNALNQEIVVNENSSFRVVSAVGNARWTVAGQVGAVVDGYVTVDVTVEAADIASRVTDGEMTSRLKLKTNEYLGTSHGAHTIILRNPWIRRGLDPVAVLAQSLTQRDAGFYAAMTYLGELGPSAKAAVPNLIDVLKEENGSLHGELHNTAHHKAAETLGKIGPDAKPAVPALLEALKNPNGHVRVAAALALWRVARHPSSVPALIESLNDRTKGIRFEAIESLGEIGVEAPSATSALREALSDVVPSLRVRAAVALWQISRDPEAIDALLAALQHEDQKVRQSAAGAFGQFGPAAKRAIPALVQSVLNDHRHVQYWGAESLTRIDPNAIFTVPEFARIIKTGKQRVNAGKALRRFDRCAIPALATMLNEKDENVRRMALGALYGFGAAAVDSLIPLLSHEDEDARVMAARTLISIGPEAKTAIPALVRTLHDEDEPVRTAAYSALVEIGAPAVPAVAAALNDENAEVRRLVAVTLGEIGPDAEAAVPQLRTLLDDRDEAVREAADIALKRIKRP